jgi:septal ring factor EnvC (AmiA/AmiB activator)
MRTTFRLLPLAAILAAGVALAQPAGKLARLSVEETSLTAEQALNMNRLARLLSVLEQFRRDPPPALLVSPDDARQAVRAAILVKAMTPELQRRAQSYAKGASEIMRQRRLAAVQSEALFTQESLAADHVPEPATPSAAIKPANGPVSPPARLTWPVEAPVIRAFGVEMAGGGRTEGLTFATPKGSKVLSPGEGVVQYVGPVRGWGVILILRLTGGYHLVLAGLDRSQASVGQSVAPGQAVGWMPDGRQSTSELYLEVREHGAPVDPGRWLRK